MHEPLICHSTLWKLFPMSSTFFWSEKHSHQFVKTLSIAIASMGVTFSMPSLALFAQDQTNQEQAEQQQTDQPREPRAQRRANRRQQDAALTPDIQQPDRKADQQAEGESAALGVIVGSCPGNAVCVRDTISGSPADEAGLREGDYILSVNEQQVTSPMKLKQVIEAMKASDKVTLRFWRDGREMTENVTLAAKAEQPPESHRAWFGVQLSPGGEKGVTVERVQPRSPAEKSGIQEGDLIVKLNDKEIEDPRSFVACIEGLGPESDVTLIVERDGNEETLKGKLGDVSDAPMAFIREAIQGRIGRGGNPLHQDGMEMQHMMMDEALDEMRDRIRKLEKQVEELKGAGEKDDEASDDEASDDEASDDEASDDVDLTLWKDGTGVSEETLIVQRNRGRGFDNSQRDRGYRYTPYDRNSSRYRSYSTPLYRSPGYGHSYYRYSGRPYYYGGSGYGNRYGYGLRSGGIQLGSNFGIYW